jgi:hypothetical protein
MLFTDDNIPHTFVKPFQDTELFLLDVMKILLDVQTGCTRCTRYIATVVRNPGFRR